MRRPVLLSLGLLFVVVPGCENPSGPGADTDAIATIASPLIGGGASISIQKFTNDEDADVAPGPSFLVGDPVVWEYRVTNNGTEPLNSVSVSDDQEGFVCWVGLLGIGQEAVCTKEGVAGAGQYTNVGTVSGFGFLFPVQASDPSHYMGEDPGAKAPSLLEVDVLIKPGDENSCMNPRSKGRTPVAILSSVEFDALDVDPSSVLAGGLISPVRWGRGEDVDGDGLMDRVFHFNTQELNNAGLLLDGEYLEISGELMEGGSFMGSDMVRLVRGPFCK